MGSVTGQLTCARVTIPVSAATTGYRSDMTSTAMPISDFPLQLELDAPLTVARWRPLVHWLLAIPQILVLYVLSAVQGVVWLISFFAILFTGKLPEGLFGFHVMTMRYQWRVYSYLLFMREPYPEFVFPMEGNDPGTEPARLSIQPAEHLSRGMIFIKWLLAIPHYIVLLLLGIVVYVFVIIGFFAVLITGAWPEGMRNFIVGYMRWTMRVNAYVYLLTDRYPAFSLA
jgi:hypothetical protein